MIGYPTFLAVGSAKATGTNHMFAPLCLPIAAPECGTPYRKVIVYERGARNARPYLFLI